MRASERGCGRTGGARGEGMGDCLHSGEVGGRREGGDAEMVDAFALVPI